MEILFKEFNSTSENNLIAFLDSNINSDYFYARGFERAGYLLYETWVGKEEREEDNTSIDCIVYPIYMCYRQAIELWYKKLIRTNNRTVKTGHIIKDIHNYLVENNNYPDGLKKSLIDNKNFIEYLNEIDPFFDRFRYDTTIKQQRQNNKNELDLKGMVEGFQQSCAVLEKIWDHVSENELHKDGFVQDNHYKRIFK